MIKLPTLAVCAIAALAGCKSHDAAPPTPAPAAAPAPPPEPVTPPAQPKTATATLQSRAEHPIAGTVTFTESDGVVAIAARITGLSPGKHGFHVHDTGDCSAVDFGSAGGHFNPDGMQHGAPGAPSHHAGDLGNLEVGEDGSVTHAATSRRITLGDGTTSIIGRAVIVHENADDLTTQPTGAAGGRLACGIIERAQ
jgi:Cu-Zn family superoxide dismutase